MNYFLPVIEGGTTRFGRLSTLNTDPFKSYPIHWTNWSYTWMKSVPNISQNWLVVFNYECLHVLFVSSDIVTYQTRRELIDAEFPACSLLYCLLTYTSSTLSVSFAQYWFLPFFKYYESGQWEICGRRGRWIRRIRPRTCVTMGAPTYLFPISVESDSHHRFITFNTMTFLMIYQHITPLIYLMNWTSNVHSDLFAPFVAVYPWSPTDSLGHLVTSMPSQTRTHRLG